MKHIHGKTAVVFCFLFLLCPGLPSLLQARTVNTVPDRPALVLAAFGSTQPDALADILAVRDAARIAFSGMPVKLAFTSDIVRRVWQKRAKDKAFLAANPGIDPDVLQVKGPIAVIADLQDQGFGSIVVQPLHIAAAEEYQDLAAVVAAFNGIRSVKERNRPLNRVALGRPLLGVPGITHPYREDIHRAAAVLLADLETARGQKSALIYMGHGNDHFSTGVYLELEDALRQLAPEPPVFFCMVEGFPSFDHLRQRLKQEKIKKALVQPFMLVAGTHAREDMAGDDPGSLKKLLAGDGIQTETRMRGLGALPGVVRIFVDHARDAAMDAGIGTGEKR